jgi:hypothetical protein
MGLFGAHVAIQVLEQQPHQVEFVWLAGCAQDSKRITTRASARPAETRAATF